ncbi:MAG TPA: hypothetical protein VGD58_04310 [Herpetosiphonaceae bacterium]
MPDTLFHISDQPGITRFEPRPAPGPNPTQTGAMVWAIDQQHLHNYLLPRDCPRVTFYALPESSPEDVTRLLSYSSASYIIAIEAGWLPAVQRQRLYCYELPGAEFALLDAGAGYYISREPVIPRAVTAIDDLLGELLRHDVELRIMPSLWPLYDAVVASTLQFSIIRMRNAQPRESA